MSIDTLSLVLIVGMLTGASLVVFLIWDAKRAKAANAADKAYKRKETGVEDV